MAKFRKKPVVIEAVQLRWDTWYEMGTFIEIGHGLGNPHGISVAESERLEIRIPTLEGTMQAVEGDWIIKGIKGELYPCRDDIFRATYEQVEDVQRGPVCCVTYEYTPDSVSAPGETLYEIMEPLFTGEAPFDERVIAGLGILHPDIPATFWQERERKYRKWVSERELLNNHEIRIRKLEYAAMVAGKEDDDGE